MGGQTTTFIYDGDGNLVKKVKPDGSKTIYVGGLYEVDKTSGGTGTRTVTYYPAGGAMRINIIGGSNTLYYILKDHLGSASVVTDASGNTVGEQRYYPYGETRLTTGTIYTDKLFTGQREMTGLGIYHYGARFYSPYLNHFIQPDTIVPDQYNPQDLNRYSYARNNPMRYTDPTGHWACDDQDENGKCINYEQIQKRKITNLRRALKNFKELPTYSAEKMIPAPFPGYDTVGLTPEENRMVQNDLMFLLVGGTSLNASRTAGKLFPGQGDHSPRNAFQHAYWNALLVSAFGEDFATEFTTAHEKGVGSVREDQFMDLHNNEVGRQIGLDNPNAPAYVLTAKVLEALQAGELYVWDEHDIYFSDQCPLCIAK